MDPKMLRCRVARAAPDTFTITLADGETTLDALEVGVGDCEEVAATLRARLLPAIHAAGASGSPVGLEVHDDSMFVGLLVGASLGLPFDEILVPEPVTVSEEPFGPEPDDGFDPSAEPTTDAPEAQAAPTSTAPLDAGPPGAQAATDPAAPLDADSSEARAATNPPAIDAQTDRTSGPGPLAPTAPPPRPEPRPRGATPEAAPTETLNQHLFRLETETRRRNAKAEDVARSIRSRAALPDDVEALIDRRVRRGLEARRLLEQLDQQARKKGTAAVGPALEHFCRAFPHLKAKARAIVETAEASRERRTEEQSAREFGLPLSGVAAPDRSHRIADLGPAPRWLLLVDETGQFPGDHGSRDATGRFVGLLLPDPPPLPPLDARWHAVGLGNAKIDRVVQATLEADAGILGLSLGALPPGAHDRWEVGILELVHWVARLLPMDGPTALSVEIEQRGIHNPASSWKAAFAEVWRQLAQANPKRYANLRFDVRLRSKADHPFGGYVDALAFTWGSGAPTSRERLERSGLEGHCLMTGDARTLRVAWDKFGKGVGLSGEEWSTLVLDPDAAQPRSVAGTLLAQLADACRSDPALWDRFFQAAQAHLDGKAVRLADLGRQFEWLERCAPREGLLLPRARLALLTARRERLNHLGDVEPGLDAELEELSRRLLEESPTLVCQADLDRAVLFTHRFDFDGATRALGRWADLPPATPGLQHWARVQSSLGQHEAFRGRLVRARDYFDRAIEAFSRLSDPRLASLETSQTACYRAIATMDDDSVPDQEARARVGELVCLEPQAIARMAGSAEARDRYSHHLLLRFLAHRGSPAEREAYLSTRDEWEIGFGHPWQLIEAHRALLLRATDPAEASERMACACRLAEEQGPTVQFIGLVLAAFGESWGFESGLVTASALDRLHRLLPLAPWTALSEGVDTGIPDPLAFLRATLPFNFR